MGEQAGSPWRRVAILASAGIMAGQGFSRFTYGLLLPRMVATGVIHSNSVASWYSTCYQIAFLCGVGSLFVVARFMPPLSILVLGVFLSVLGLGAMGLAHGSDLVVIALLVLGLSGAFTYVPAMATTGGAVPDRSRAWGFGITGAGLGAGIMIARLIGALSGAESTSQGWRHVWFAEAGVSALVFFVLVSAAIQLPSSVDTSRIRLKTITHMPGWSRLVLGYLCFGIAYTLYANFATTGWEHAGLGKNGAADAFFVAGPFLIVGSAFFPALGKLSGRRVTLGIGYMFLALSAAEVLSAFGQPLAFGSAVLFGLAGAGIPVVMASGIQEHLKSTHSDVGRSMTAVFGLVTFCYGLGTVVGPLVSTALVRTGGRLISAFAFAAGTALTGALAVITLPTLEKGSHLEASTS